MSTRSLSSYPTVAVLPDLSAVQSNSFVLTGVLYETEAPCSCRVGYLRSPSPPAKYHRSNFGPRSSDPWTPENPRHSGEPPRCCLASLSREASQAHCRVARASDDVLTSDESSSCRARLTPRPRDQRRVV